MPVSEKVKKGLGEIEQIYAGQAIEQINARQLIDKGNSLTAIEDAVRSILEEGDCSIEHIDEQIERIREFLFVNSEGRRFYGGLFL